METKLTLRLDEEVIQRAKKYAASQKSSLSKLIESYLDSITKEKSEMKNVEPTPLVERLSGVISFESDFNEKETYHSYLEEKYK
jgi:dsDNA-specific endonuclease/ATPase MutS2